MKKSLLFFTLPLVSIIVMSCAGKLESQGESLAAIIDEKEASAGKTYSLTLSQINIERDNTGAYVRLFDKDYKTIFVYVQDPPLKNKVANLERNAKYIYKFSVTKNDSYSTLSGKLIDVAALDGKPIDKKLKDPAPSARMIILDGPDAIGKTFTLSLAFNDVKEENGKKVAQYQSPDAYSTSVTCEVPDDQADKVKNLKASEKYSVKLKVDRVDWRIFGTLVSVE